MTPIFMLYSNKTLQGFQVGVRHNNDTYADLQVHVHVIGQDYGNLGTCLQFSFNVQLWHNISRIR